MTDKILADEVMHYLTIELRSMAIATEQLGLPSITAQLGDIAKSMTDCQRLQMLIDVSFFNGSANGSVRSLLNGVSKQVTGCLEDIQTSYIDRDHDEVDPFATPDVEWE